MATPKIVQRQLEEAEALQQSLQPTAANADQAPEPPAEPPAPAAPPSDTSWEHRFKTLQGMYNADTGQLRAQNKLFEADLGQMREQVRALQQVATAPKPAEAQVDPRDVESFGAELIEMVQKYATQAYGAMRDEFGSLATKLDARVAELEGTVTGVSKQAAQSAEEQFYATLDKLVPDWRQINDDQRFLEWLGQVDPVYGVPRQVGLNAAHQALKADHAARVFTAFKGMLPTKPTQAALVSPRGSAGAEAPSTQEAKPRLARKFIETFFNDQARGRYRGREAEAERIEADINLAVAEGRVM